MRILSERKSINFIRFLAGFADIRQFAVAEKNFHGLFTVNG